MEAYKLQNKISPVIFLQYDRDCCIKEGDLKQKQIFLSV